MSLNKRKSLFSKWQRKSGLTDGMNLPEVTLTVGVVGILAALTAPAFTLGTNPLGDSMNLVEGNFKLARSKAMSQTKAYRIRPLTADSFIMEKHVGSAGSSIYSCDDAGSNTDSDGNALWETATGFQTGEDMALKEGIRVKSVEVDGVQLSNLTDWELCYDARGMASKNVVLTLEEGETNDEKVLEVFAGGSLVAYDSVRFNQGASSSASISNVGPGNSNGSGNSGESNYSENASNPGNSEDASNSENSSQNSGNSSNNSTVANNSGGNSNGNNGHGNNIDGVDSSNPGQGQGGPNGRVDASNGVDDERNGNSAQASSLTNSNNQPNAGSSNSNSQTVASNSGSSSNSQSSASNSNSQSNTSNGSGHSNNGHGNNIDGVDSSNPGRGQGGPNGRVDASNGVDDERNNIGTRATASGNTPTTTASSNSNTPTTTSSSGGGRGRGRQCFRIGRHRFCIGG